MHVLFSFWATMRNKVVLAPFTDTRMRCKRRNLLFGLEIKTCSRTEGSVQEPVVSQQESFQELRFCVLASIWATAREFGYKTTQKSSPDHLSENSQEMWSRSLLC